MRGRGLGCENHNRQSLAVTRAQQEVMEQTWLGEASALRESTRPSSHASCSVVRCYRSRVELTSQEEQRCTAGSRVPRVLRGGHLQTRPQQCSKLSSRFSKKAHWVKVLAAKPHGSLKIQPWNAHGGRRESVPESCPLTSVHTGAHPPTHTSSHPHKHTHTLTHTPRH